MLSKVTKTDKQNIKINKNMLLNDLKNTPIFIFSVNPIVVVYDSTQCTTSIKSFDQSKKTIISEFDNTNYLCFNNTPKNTSQKNPFTEEEDNLISQLVKCFGENNWSAVSQHMKQNNFDRNIRQCRDRYYHYLNPKIKNSEWTTEEDELLMENVKKNGNRWKKMEKFFPGRTEVSLRNRYNLLIRKQNKIAKKIKKKSDIMSDNFSFLDSYYDKKKKSCKNSECNDICITYQTDKKISDDEWNLNITELYDDKSNNIYDFDDSLFNQ